MTDRSQTERLGETSAISTCAIVTWSRLRRDRYYYRDALSPISRGLERRSTIGIEAAGFQQEGASSNEDDRRSSPLPARSKSQRAKFDSFSILQSCYVAERSGANTVNAVNKQTGDAESRTRGSSSILVASRRCVAK
jgi:hypothetical protein